MSGVQNSLSVLLDPSGQMKLAEQYKGVLENVQKLAVSTKLKNTELSGDPTTGSVEAKRFVNATSQAYGTARTGGAGNKVKGKTVTVKIDTDREFVEEIEQKDISLLGVDGLLAKRSANHALRLAAELDEAFFAKAVSAGSQFTPAEGVTAIQDIVEDAIVSLSILKTNYIDGLDRSQMQITFDPQTYSAMRKYLDTVHNTNVDTTTEEFTAFHGVRCDQSNRLPRGVHFILEIVGSIAQPVISKPYGAERIPLSEAIAVELFFYYGTEAVTPETILYYGTPSNS